MRFVSPYHKGIVIQRGGGRKQLGSGFRNVFRSILAKVVPYAIKGIKSIRSVEACKECINEIQKVAVDQGMKAVNKAIKRTANKIIEQHETVESEHNKKRKKETTTSTSTNNSNSSSIGTKKGSPKKPAKKGAAQTNKKNKKKKNKGSGIF